MATLNKLKKLIHRKVPEFCSPLPAGNTAAGGFLVADKSNLVPGHDSMYYVGGISAIWNYNADEDAWLQLPNSGAAGTFAAGSCGEYRAMSAPGGIFTQTAGASGHSVNQLTTSLNIKHNCKGYQLRIVEGPGAGYVGNIKYVATGANAIIYPETPFPVTPTSATKFQIFGGSLWFFNAGTSAVGFSAYDRITNTWTSRSVTGIPTAWGTDGQLISTKGAEANFFQSRVASASTTVITLNAEDFNVNINTKLTNLQLRVIAGTGNGQIRTISSVVDNVVSVATAFSPQLDNTSVVVVEGNEDHFYLMGNNAVTLYRFSVSGNAWTTLAPTAARAAASGAGGCACWIDGVPDASWNSQSPTMLYTGIYRQSGRYIYCFRGGASNALDVYDIALNTWISNVLYAGQNETFTTGSCAVDDDGMIFLMKESTGRFFRFNVAQNVLEPWFNTPLPNGTAVVGDKVTVQTFYDGGDEIKYFYALPHTRTELVRLVIV